jgi:DNA-binding IclR family transcriptional regulator
MSAIASNAARASGMTERQPTSFSAPLGPTEVAAVTGMQSDSVRRILGKLVAKGEIEKSVRGCYRAILKGIDSGNNWADRN